VLINVGLNRAHEERFTCQTCYLIFETVEEREEHHYSAHGRDLWPFVADGEIEAAFARLYPKVLNPDYDICCYCGRLFLGLLLEECINHSVDIHDFGGCNQSGVLFYGAARFRRHLKKRHGAVDGQWVSTLEAARVRPNTTSGAPKTNSTFLSRARVNAFSLGCGTQ
jgi:hypothetical protein